MEHRRDVPDDIAEYVGGLEDTNRNLAIYGRLIIDTSADDYVFALDATTGRLVWETQILDYKTVPARQSSGPIIANGKLISGRSCRPRGGPASCVITAHDASTGEELWRTSTIPAPGEPGDETWLQLRNLDAVHPAVPLFPDFDDGLRQAFRRETELFVDSVLREDRSALELLTADYTFVNERLALHYGLPSVRGSHFRRVALGETARRGLLGHGSILTVTSRPNRTSPVLRGKWILENILGTPPPAPPPNVPPLPGDEGGAAKAHTMRQRMAAHRANPACASCHAMIDPPGFALENFDALGRWRDVDASFNPIDASGRLPNGMTFADLAEFRTLLLSRPEQFVTTITEKLLTYALGRGLEPHDMPGVRSITREAASGNFKLSALVEGIVSRQAFLMRRTASEVEEAQ